MKKKVNASVMDKLENAENEYVELNKKKHNHAPPKAGEPPPGLIHRIAIRNVTAHGQGTSRIYGHAERWLDGLNIENLKLHLSADPAAPYDSADHALDFRRAQNLKLKDVEVIWEKPSLPAWQSALHLEDVRGLELDGFTGRGAWPEGNRPAVVLNQVSEAIIRRARATAGTTVFLNVVGARSREIRIQGNDFRLAKIPWQIDSAVPAAAVTLLENMLPDY